MAEKPSTRRDISARKEAMAKDLRRAWREAASSPGDTMISVRELSARYGLALRTVSLELAKLAEEGVLYTIPRVGTFVGKPRSGQRELFLAIFPVAQWAGTHYGIIRNGFEERIAQLGGSCLALDAASAQTYLQAQSGPAPAGVFEVTSSQVCADPYRPPWGQKGLPGVVYGNIPAGQDLDRVDFDNFAGGRLATRHLLQEGHRKIAFLALHAEQGVDGVFTWSREREAGWRSSLQEAGCQVDGRSFHPRQTSGSDIQEQFQTGLEVAWACLGISDITAVVAVNINAARAFYQALRASGRPASEWPALVSFDIEALELTDGPLHLLTTLRLPWEELGREAADLLWQRAHGQISAPAVRRLVPLSLIPRLSCRQDWPLLPLGADMAVTAPEAEYSSAPLAPKN